MGGEARERKREQFFKERDVSAGRCRARYAGMSGRSAIILAADGRYWREWYRSDYEHMEFMSVAHPDPEPDYSGLREGADDGR